MRALILSLCLVASSAASDSPYLTGEALQAEVVRSCAGGCVVFSQAEAQALEAGIGRMVEDRARAAF